MNQTDYKDIRITNRINIYTGGEIGNFTSPGDGVTHKNQFFYGEHWLGDFDVAMLFMKEKFFIHPTYPGSVAIVLKEHTHLVKSWRQRGLSVKQYIKELEGDDNIKGMFGYTYRGGQIFKIGDRLCSPNYRPERKHFPESMWIRWTAEKKACCLEDPKNHPIGPGLRGYIPGNWMGRAVIKNWKEAGLAAKNFAISLL